jgi:FHS family L-fucose permease-like MFS transporter
MAMISELAADAPQSASAPPPTAALRGAQVTLTALFFAIGFLTCLNDIIVPHFKAMFALDYTRAMLVQLSFFTAYFVVSPPAGVLIGRVGYRRGIAAGLAVAATGCVGFVPAAILRSYPIFLGALFVLASGFTILQVAANPYVAILGDRATASSRLTLTQAFNSLGTTIAPLVGSAFLVSSDAATDGARGLITPYVGFALTLLAMSVALFVMRLPDAAPDAASAAADSIWSHGPLRWGVVGIFVYVGAEVAIGSFLVSFLREPDIGALDATTAARCVSLYWGGAMIGRFAGAPILRRYAPRTVLAACGAVAFLLVAATIAFGGPAAMVTILAVGLFNSIMFPTIFTLAIAGLGERTGRGSGALCMAIVGGAILPVVQGAVADRFGVHAAFVVPLACYAYIVWYGVSGSIPAARGLS